MSDFKELAGLLDKLSGTLEKLTETQRAVIQAVRADDLVALNECMKKQQTLSLSLRGLNQKRERIQKALGMENVKLKDLLAHTPNSEERNLLRVSIDKLTSEYRVMQSASEAARSRLECGLHEVDKRIASMGLDTKQMSGAPLTDGSTDFRA